MDIRELFEKEYGVICDTVENPITDTVPANIITQLLKGDPGRLNYIIVNLGAVPLYFCFTPDPSANKGIYLAANGGSDFLDWKDDGIITTYPLYAFATAQVKVYIIGLRIIGLKE